jgi:3-oxoacyl-[acyl-carrier protein] reductase
MSTERLLILGAGSDIGHALIAHLRRDRPDLKIMAHVRRFASILPDDLRDPALSWFEADLTQDIEISRMLDEIQAQKLTPSGIVFLPGLPLRYERMIKFDLEHFSKDLDVQVLSAIKLLKKLLPDMLKLPLAKLVFVNSSVTRGLPPKHLSMYAIVKHAQLGLMKSLASDYAGTALRANAVSPSMVKTKFLSALPASLIESAAATMPGKRNIELQDVVLAITFLLGAGGDAISGIELPVSGGSVV